jgi:LCP family protein required for cell wall assembly
MTVRSRAVPIALLLCLSLVGCDLLAGAPTTSPSPVATLAPTRRPRQSPRATPVVSTDPAASAAATPRRTRRPRSSPTPTPVPTPTPTPFPPIVGLERIAGSDGRFTVLLLGSDARGKLLGERTDTIMVVSIDPSTGRVSMASLPRDTVDVPIGDGQVFASPNRINGLLQHFQLGGAGRKEALRRTTRAMAAAFDIEIDHYVLIGFVGLKRLIDQIGGIDVELDQPLFDPTMHTSKKGLRLNAGVNHLSGKRALAFARTRKTDSDYHRAARQQQMIAATAIKVLDGGLAAFPALAEFALTQVETDIPLDAWPLLVELAGRARLRTYKGVVLSPPVYASEGPVLFTIQMNLTSVRSMFDRLFGPVS